MLLGGGNFCGKIETFFLLKKNCQSVKQTSQLFYFHALELHPRQTKLSGSGKIKEIHSIYCQCTFNPLDKSSQEREREREKSSLLPPPDKQNE